LIFLSANNGKLAVWREFARSLK